MAANANRDDFKPATVAALAKRAGFRCSICRALTIGPSAESPSAITNVGIAAHIAAAAPRGKRYNASMTPAERSGIANAIWLCGIHAKAIDDDPVTWTVLKLNATKKVHEKHVSGMLGIPDLAHVQQWNESAASNSRSIEVREYAFAPVGGLVEMYKKFINPILEDRKLSDDAMLGMLFCGSKPDEPRDDTYRAPWTVFVDAKWLKWFVKRQSSGFKAANEVPPEHVYGQVPAWPDSLVEFLVAIVMTKGTFYWKRHPKGYLMLCQ